MKKIILSLTLLCLASCLLCACGKETPLLTAADYVLDEETGSTSRGVKIGDEGETFQAAYREDMIFAAVAETAADTSSEGDSDTVTDTSSKEDSDTAADTSSKEDSDTAADTLTEDISRTSYQLLPADEIPFDTVTTTILPTFFIDGLPVDTDQFCEDNEIEKTNLLSYLTDESYLSDHRVIYRYLVFSWENGVITDIRSESMDYNQDASYYEAN